MMMPKEEVSESGRAARSTGLADHDFSLVPGGGTRRLRRL